MLKKFFMQVLSSFMGAWIAIMLSGLAAAIVVVGLVGISFSRQIEVPDNSVLKISLSGSLIEREDAASLNLQTLLASTTTNYQTVETLVNAITEAKNNSKVKAIYLDCGDISTGAASANAVRDALLSFKASGKKIYAYGDNIGQATYYIASVASELYLNPVGSLNLHGVGGEYLFYKGLFDKLGIEFQAVRVGEGKSAVEPYTCEQMSDYARAQSMELFDTIWSNMRQGLADARKISAANLDSIVSRDYVAMQAPAYLLKQKLIDGTMYRNQYEDRIAKELGMEDGLGKCLEPAPLAATLSGWGGVDNTKSKQVAVVYATGEIDGMMGGNSGINSQNLVELILKLAKDKNISGMVLRVNSPGGSAFGSEQIWAALQEFKKAGKPLAVSMGDYAASGGYYISCCADQIFADKMTITGSIGIFGLIPNMQGLLQKLGVNAEIVATNKEAVYLTGYQSLTDGQLAAMQGMVDEGYAVFTKRCADGRNLPIEKIREVADGRPLSAQAALQYKLIDKIGGLQQAIDWVAAKASLGTPYAVGVYPVIEQNWQTMLSDVMQEKLAPVYAAIESGRLNKVALELIQRIMNADRVKAVMMTPVPVM